MVMKITINEASPRKFRAKPSDRGVGGKWGPVDTTNAGKNNREQSAKDWKDQGTLDPAFKALLKKELDNAGTPFKINDDANEDGAFTWFIAKLNDFGINNINTSMVGNETVDCNDSNLPRNGIARLLNKICSDVLEDDEKGGAGVGLTFGSSDEDSYDTVWCDIFYPLIDDPNLLDGESYPTRKKIVTDSIDKVRAVTAYLKKMAPVINRESSRTFHESKCSMQKRIESFRK